MLKRQEAVCVFYANIDVAFRRLGADVAELACILQIILSIVFKQIGNAIGQGDVHPARPMQIDRGRACFPCQGNGAQRAIHIGGADAAVKGTGSQLLVQMKGEVKAILRAQGV